MPDTTYNWKYGYWTEYASGGTETVLYSSTVSSDTIYLNGQKLNEIVSNLEDKTVLWSDIVGAPIFLEKTEFFLSDNNFEPLSATDFGEKGEIRITSDYIYICVDSNTWKRVALTTW